MSRTESKLSRRNFLKSSALAGGGLMISFSWLVSCNSKREEALGLPEEWFELNGFLKIGDNGLVTIMAPNPEFGQNVTTSLPMIIGEELDVDWNKVIVEQAKFNTDVFTRQFAGGSQSVRQGWVNGLREAGAAAKYMLKEAAAKQWGVSASDITTKEGVLSHVASGNSAGYGEMASLAVGIEIPETLELKKPSELTLVGTARKNVRGKDIVTGKPMFGIDYEEEGMLIAMIIHPPAFGMRLKSFDATTAKQMSGIKEVFTITSFPNDEPRGYFSTDAFTETVVVVGNTTWEVMQAKKAVRVEWEQSPATQITTAGFGGTQQVTVPAGLENSTDHYRLMQQMAARPGRIERRDGNPEAAFKKAAKVIERTYTAPFLAHNAMEPMNFFARVTDDMVHLAGPLQAPEFAEQAVANRLGVPLEKVDIKMTRMGGGFGRRAYDHYVVEAALISRHMKAPVKLVYTREDDMTNGIYRPSYHATYRAALDENNNLIAFHAKAGGIPESPLHANRFPAGAVENYLAESWQIDSNITVGAFRAPRSNFIAGAEQSFLDEVAEAAGKDPIEFRLELLKRARENPVGDRNDYEADRYAGVLELVREKSNWDQPEEGVSRGVSAYFCHNSYVAHVLDVEMEGGEPRVKKVTCAVDCGIVINPLAAANMVEGAVVDGIGHSLYSYLTFNNGATEQNNFNRYRMIRHSEAPETIDVHFVKNDIAPTGLGEPPFPPVFAAVANALYKATGKRHYNQPYMVQQQISLG
ncbi:xanthine dehydrogenase family protein molybdopterin-binding subunit [Roseivirga thermotolerans]|uniref:Isoquinoline 1-oxidoreductase subunit beta n=1 Tax=Roseivirga thermotolerans TaxID=1758176 RepID=A0ABQ3I810_9BACT|nr:molybdopterin cofactor-binding domain-containing protein [Roseivirga thermotolerans]GHE63015.1 isoquinoline 1-oxidoreductase subunit beta [Roseivirga thermotolerans]